MVSPWYRYAAARALLMSTLSLSMIVPVSCASDLNTAGVHSPLAMDEVVVRVDGAYLGLSLQDIEYKGVFGSFNYNMGRVISRTLFSR